MMINRLYKHQRNTDVALLPKRIKPYEEGYTVTCYWFNIVNRKNIFLCTDRLDTVFIKREDLSKWELLDEQV
jgi:hypothetical protein